MFRGDLNCPDSNNGPFYEGVVLESDIKVLLQKRSRIFCPFRVDCFQEEYGEFVGTKLAVRGECNVP